MNEWHQQVQRIADDIDRCIANRDDDGLTLRMLAAKRGYSEYHMTRKFKQLAGMSLREYLRGRRLAFALDEVMNTDRSLLDIALDYGWSSHEAFGRSFKSAFGIPPSTFRARPRPVSLHTKLNTFDRFLLGSGGIGMVQSSNELKIYFVRMQPHRFLHIKNYDSNGYFDFWERQDRIEGQDCDTICDYLDRVEGKLDGEDGVIGRYSGQVMDRVFHVRSRAFRETHRASCSQVISDGIGRFSKRHKGSVILL